MKKFIEKVLKRDIESQSDKVMLQKTNSLVNEKVESKYDEGISAYQETNSSISGKSDENEYVDLMHKKEIQDKIALIEKVDFSKEVQDKDTFVQLEESFMTELEKAFNKKDENCLVVLCCDFRELRDYEAIRKEAYYTFLLLKAQSHFNVKLVSIEHNQKEIEFDAGIVYLSEERAEEYFRSIDVRAIIAVEATVGIALMANGLFLKYNTILRLTGQNPLEGMSEEAYNALSHVNDMGTQHYIVQSRFAKETMENAGFKNVTLSYPIMDTRQFQKKASRKLGNKMVVGFASAPMQKEQQEDRGVFLLSELIARSGDCEFIVLWRCGELEAPQIMRDAPNCKMVYGKCDMKEFYERIDCLIIPYAGVNKNHACSISALEAVVAGIPVICTEKSGVSDLIGLFEVGRVCEATVEALYDAIGYVQKTDNICTDFKIKQMLDEMNKFNFVEYVEKICERYVPDEIITIGEWQKKLEENGKYLVKGQEEIKKYYSQFDIAVNYNEDRFSHFPQNCIDFLERKTVCAIIQNKSRNKKIKILDIAPGDGRIVQENIKYGYCVAADASEAMINVLENRFKDSDNLKTIQVDYFNDEVEGEFDAITTFRYIRHFEYKKRKILYRKIRDNLKKDGILIFDVPNIKFEMKLREVTGWGNYNIYDVFWTREDMVQELEENGFRVEYIIAVGDGLMKEVPDEYASEPITWTFGAIKR